MILFSAEKVKVMVKPFKLALVGKFSFGQPSTDLIRKFFVTLRLKENSQVSLLDNGHVLINLSIKEDYYRILAASDLVYHGRSMRIFKWSSIESLIVHV